MEQWAGVQARIQTPPGAIATAVLTFLFILWLTTTLTAIFT
jgi:hypothetical protein